MTVKEKGPKAMPNNKPTIEMLVKSFICKEYIPKLILHDLPEDLTVYSLVLLQTFFSYLR